MKQPDWMFIYVMNYCLINRSLFVYLLFLQSFSEIKIYFRNEKKKSQIKTNSSCRSRSILLSIPINQSCSLINQPSLRQNIRLIELSDWLDWNGAKWTQLIMKYNNSWLLTEWLIAACLIQFGFISDFRN